MKKQLLNYEAKMNFRTLEILLDVTETKLSMKASRNQIGVIALPRVQVWLLRSGSPRFNVFS